MKIREKERPIKLQQGGIPPFVSFVPVPQPVSAAPQEATPSTGNENKDSKKKGVGILTEDMIKMMYTEGLVSDVGDLVGKLDMFMSSQFENLPPEALVDRYKVLIMGLTRIKEGKRQLVKAQDEIHKNDAMNEIAVSNNNTYFILSPEGQIQESVNIMPGEKVLTNAELLDLRANYLPYADNITNIVSQAPSMKNIDSRISAAISGLGNETMNNKYIYSAKDRDEIIKGVNFLVNSEEGLAALPAVAQKGDNVVETKEESNTRYVEKALAYIYSTLTSREKALLQGKAQQMGDNTPYGSFNIIQNVLSSKVKIKHDVSVTPDTSKKGKSGDGTGESSVNITPTLAYNTREGGVEDMLKINPRGKSAAYIPVITHDTPVDNDMKSLANKTVSEFMHKALPMTADSNAVYFGAQKVDASTLDSIMVDGRKLSTAYLPTDPYDPSRPYFEIFDQYAKAAKEFGNPNQITTPEEQERWAGILEEYGLGELLSAHGKIDSNRFGFYTLVDGYATGTDNWIFSDEGFIPEEGNNFVEEVGKGVSANVTTEEKMRSSSIDPKAVKKIMQENEMQVMDKLYSGVIYIKTNTGLGSVIGSGAKLPMTSEKTSVDRYKKRESLGKEKKKEKDFDFKSVSVDLLN